METEKPVIEFHLDGQSGVAPYLQIVQQVKQALRLGLLQPGDQLPTMREIVAKLAINPNTVFKASGPSKWRGWWAVVLGAAHLSRAPWMGQHGPI
ncbi:MAG TPA: GntR family transcriptional regulator [Ktedonosporobacter sp.]|nr:GntR family transcriptional regulator [Ktedonosporobacter sp.]